MGRHAKHTTVKEAQGTERNTRKIAAPTQAEGMPVAPGWLSDRAVELFNEIVMRLLEVKLASITYEGVIALLATRLAEIEECEAAIRNHQRFYQTVTPQGAKVWKEHPAVKLRDVALRHAQSLYSELGLTPASIGRVGAKKVLPKSGETEEKNPLEGIKR